MRKLRETSRQERELRLVIREMISEAGPVAQVAQIQRAATGAARAATRAFEDLLDSAGSYKYRVFPNGALQIIKSAANPKVTAQNPLTVTTKNKYYQMIVGDLKSANPSSPTLASRVFGAVVAAASSTAKAAAAALSTGPSAPSAQAAPTPAPAQTPTFTSDTGAPAAVGSSDVAGVSMYGAKVGDSETYTEYRVYTNGMIKRFGIMKKGKWKMDDPAVDIPADKLKATAGAILAANQYDAAAKAALDGIVAGTLTGTGGVGADTFQRAASWMRRTLARAGAPIAYVAFADYLMGRTSTFTEKDLPPQYQADLAKVAKYALSVTTPSGKKGYLLHNNEWVYNTFWRTASDKLGQGIPGTPLGGVGTKGTGTVEALQFFLGGIVVTQEGQNYVISDIYDYDDYYVSPKAYDEMSEFLGAIGKAGTFYDVIRNAAGYRQSTGYKGYPVRITLPVSLAADFKV